jgi:WD40 repeat protein
MNLINYNTTINGTFNIFDFDNSTGLVSNQFSLGAFASAWGCDFSPDGSKLYGGNWWNGTLFQWDLCAGNGPAIAASVYTVYSSGTASEVHDIRTAQNGKIYVATGGKSYLGVINNPNLYGAACNFVPAGQSLAQKNSLKSLPRFMSSYLKVSPFNVAISSSINCQTASFFSSLPTSTLCSATGYSVAAVLWNFGDPASGSNNSSTLVNPVHIYSAPGSYTVKEIIYNTTCAPDTLLKAITVFGPAAILSVTGPSVICKGQSATFSVSGASTYTWSTVPVTFANNLSISVSPTVTTIYTIIGTNTVSNCSDKKTITLQVAKCTGIDEGLGDTEFIKIYPNPGCIFTIESGISFDAELYGQHGEKIMNLKLLAGVNLLDLRKYQNGLYFLRIQETGFVYKLAKTD